VENPTVVAQVERLAALVKPYCDAGDSLLRTIQDVDRREPRLTAEMRRTGILRKMSALFEAGGAVFAEYATLVRVLEQSYGIKGLGKLTGTNR
jgi:hypothetical protein